MPFYLYHFSCFALFNSTDSEQTTTKKLSGGLLREREKIETVGCFRATDGVQFCFQLVKQKLTNSPPVFLYQILTTVERDFT